MSEENSRAMLLEESGKVIRQLQGRYAHSLLKEKFADINEFRTDLVFGMERSGLDAKALSMVRKWMLSGITHFVTYPPDIEAIIQLGILVEEYPLNEYAAQIHKAWFKLDSTFGAQYQRSWRTAAPFDALQRERIWISEFEKMKATEAEIRMAIDSVSRSIAFRKFPPSMAQFLDAIQAIRVNALMVEEAWLVALSANTTTPLDARVRYAIGRAGALDIRAHGDRKDVSDRFQKAYRDSLFSDFSESHFKTAEEKTEPKELASVDAVLKALTR